MSKERKKSELEIELEQTIDFLRKRMSEYEFEYSKKLRDIKFLEEENKKLKKEVEVWKNANKILRMHDAKMEYENKELKKEREMLIEDLSSDKELQQQIAQKQVDYYRENQKLKSDLAFERTMLDNVRAEHESLQDVIKKLKEELSKYKKQYEHSMGEDDELIYEEGLYD